MKILSHDDIIGLAMKVARLIDSRHSSFQRKAFAIPRGGIPAAYAIQQHDPMILLVDDPADAEFFIDDLIDSGRTMDMWKIKYPGKPFYALLDKREPQWGDEWVQLPWEGGETGGIEDNIVRLLQFIGEDSTRQGLKETPARVAKAWTEWTNGYHKDLSKIFKAFEDGADSYDQIIIVRDIPFYSNCEHHLAPFFGTAHFGYIPNGKIIGLSKIPELINAFAHRLQVQERLTNQIVDAFQEHMQAKGVGLVMQARHLCMESRGKRVAGQSTITSALRGVMLDDASCKAEFFSLVK